ncbi:MAG: hypothetical protein LBU44_05645 [Mediterranea sp.]|jgi:hypothetical protein|nr:hypothetical protein [Mediterranea sp.]
MKRTTLLSIPVVLMLLMTTTVCAQHKVAPFEHLSVSVNAGTLGVGVQVAAPVNRFLSLRTGLMMFKYAYRYEYDGELTINGVRANVPIIDMEARANMVNGLLLADVFPFPNRRIHVTGGFYMGTPDIVKMSTLIEVDPNRIIEIGDLMIQPVNGKVSAQLKTSSFKPYAGIGFGSSVTKHNRVGFKFEMGVMFHGNPKFEIIEGKEEEVDRTMGDELSKFNDFLKDFSLYPVINFQLNFRAF